MLNVNAITSTLAKMPDAALQKYAALHKEDPYIMALAVSESNRRKQMRNAAQAPQGMPEPPKVADQAVAEMAPAQPMPEDVGIGQLPAGDMNFAGGGIIAFGDGGEVERYQSAGLVGGDLYRIDPKLARKAAQRALYATDIRPATGLGLVASVPTTLAQMYVAAMDKMRAQGYPVDTVAPEFQTDATPAQLAFDEDRRRKAIAEMSREDKLRKFGTENVNQAVQGTANTSSAPAAAPTAPPGVGLRGTLGDQTGDFPMVGTRRPPTARAAAPRPAAAPAAAAAAPAAAVPVAAGFNMTPEGLAALRKKLGKDINVEEPENLRKAREELTAEDIRAKQEVKDALARDQAKFADAFKGREERLTKRGADIAKQREENTGLAFLNAGLAMMSTPGGLATAIGKGARVGTEQYAAGLDKLRSAQDKLDEARDRMEELKLNRDMMDAKEIREAEAGINAAKVAGKNRGVEALSKMFEVSTKRADTMFTTLAEVGLTQFKEGEATKRNTADIAGRIQAAREAAARNPQLELVQAISKDPALAQAYQAMHGTKNDLMAQYTDFIKNNPTGTLEDFLRARAVFSTLGAGAPRAVTNPPAGAVAPRAP